MIPVREIWGDVFATLMATTLSHLQTSAKYHFLYETLFWSSNIRFRNYHHFPEARYHVIIFADAKPNLCRSQMSSLDIWFPPDAIFISFC